jgi:hypothetical protein
LRTEPKAQPGQTIARGAFRFVIPGHDHPPDVVEDLRPDVERVDLDGVVAEGQLDVEAVFVPVSLRAPDSDGRDGHFGALIEPESVRDADLGSGNTLERVGDQSRAVVCGGDDLAVLAKQGDDREGRIGFDPAGDAVVKEVAGREEQIDVGDRKPHAITHHRAVQDPMSRSIVRDDVDHGAPRRIEVAPEQTPLFAGVVRPDEAAPGGRERRQQEGNRLFRKDGRVPHLLEFPRRRESPVAGFAASKQREDPAVFFVGEPFRIAEADGQGLFGAPRIVPLPVAPLEVDHQGPVFERDVQVDGVANLAARRIESRHLRRGGGQRTEIAHEQEPIGPPGMWPRFRYRPPRAAAEGPRFGHERIRLERENARRRRERPRALAVQDRRPDVLAGVFAIDEVGARAGAVEDVVFDRQRDGVLPRAANDVFGGLAVRLLEARAPLAEIVEAPPPRTIGDVTGEPR